MDAVLAARTQGWRAIYFNRVTVGFWGAHVGAVVGLAVLGWSWTGLALALAVYGVKMFFVTGAYHRYFSHRSYKTSRWFQLVLAFGAQATLQKGVLWWAAHHRHHHKASDSERDLHSPHHGGFWWSHIGWIVARDFEDTDLSKVKDMARYPELVWLNQYWYVPGIAVAVGLYLVGGAHALLWGFAIAQVLCWHGTFTINSLSHLWGKRRYVTTDDSRNNWVLALLTLGEGWHNNHHHYQVSARQGFRWWEVDITFYVLRALSAVGLVLELHGVPRHIRDGAAQAPASHGDHGVLDGARGLAVAAAAAVAAPVVAAQGTAVRADHGIVASCGSRPQTSSSGAPSSS